MITELKNLSKKEFDKLKKYDLLNVIYPDAPDNFEDIKGKKPKLLKEIDWSPLLKVAESGLNDKKLKNLEYAIYENALSCIYGEDVWAYIDSLDE